MKVGIIEHEPGLSAYCAEILTTWGLCCHRTDSVQTLAAGGPEEIPVILAPSGSLSEKDRETLLGYVGRGGTLICFLPQGDLAQAAGLSEEGEKETPVRLRLVGPPAAGIAGEHLPIVGPVRSYRAEKNTRVHAFLSMPRQFEGESPGLTETALGEGHILAFAFDLPRCVMLLRQGDPARAEWIPPKDTCARPSHLAVELDAGDAAWIPYADLLSRLLVDQVRAHMNAPVPLLGHLPGSAPALLLYTGDEDGAEVAWNNEEMEAVAAAGGRMNLYLIPIQTKSTRLDAQRYLAQHDLGPHPNLRPLDGTPVSTRLKELERQITLFEEMFGVKARTLRQHSTVWPGYTEPAEVMERLGVRMEGNYFSGAYLRDRQMAFYATFGAALPMRFCHPNGRLIHVFQQHTHVADDVLFSPTAPYSYRLSAEQFAVILERTFDEMVWRFHTPLAVCIHPSNWVRFSRRQGQALLDQAATRGLPIWSFDQWCAFWEARSGVCFEEMTWKNGHLRLRIVGLGPRRDLRLWCPSSFGEQTLREVHCAGEPVEWEKATRYREEVAVVPLPSGVRECEVRVEYQ